ncbi:carbohydrate ABC transporter permease [Pararhizobium mangrovi]|uniref:Carbohydrate ABC transporter permease n=1 Tax=Pararhizobium mangrovi TaxID=2590452 RepID=A0A506TYI4_9HYPH|nr:carbohydrate ABC transporter permease [Pararhizobium mangrovi]TPW27153.1 carbohydrate ABC transporter permease [Pararhizobium mangrovi]
MNDTAVLRQPFVLRFATVGFIVFWTILAAFPLLWITLMSFKLPIDAFASDPLRVIFGFTTLRERGGLSVTALVLGAFALWLAYHGAEHHGRRFARYLALGGREWLGWLLAALVYVIALILGLFWILPAIVRVVEAILSHIPVLDYLARPMMGLTMQNYRAVWIGYRFYDNFINSMIVTTGTVVISLTVGTLAGYGLARTRSNVAFWLLIAALIFRALPHSVLVTGYLPVFIHSREFLAPLWNWHATAWFFHLFSDQPPTLYGQPLAVIMVLVSINQPFTIWMLRSFFMNIPAELDEAARVDGCSHLGAFRRVIMPVMWPGVITTGLFSFLLAYNDYLVCSLLLDAQSQTMVPAITSFFNRETTTTDQVQAVAAAVSITAPLFLLVIVFQKQIVSGLTQGAVKG